MAGLTAPRSTGKNFKKKQKPGNPSICLLARMGLVAPINREENKRKKQKGSTFIGDDKESEVLPPQLHP